MLVTIGYHALTSFRHCNSKITWSIYIGKGASENKKIKRHRKNDDVQK